MSASGPGVKVGDFFRPKEDMYYDYGNTEGWLPISSLETPNDYGRVYADQVYKVTKIREEHLGRRRFEAVDFVMVVGSREINHLSGWKYDQNYDYKGRVGGGGMTLEQIIVVKKPPSKDKRVPRFVTILEWFK